MGLRTGRWLYKGVHAGCAAAAMLLAISGAPAMADADSLAALKSATLELMQAQAEPADVPGTWSIYIGNRDAGMLLDEIRIIVDRGAQQRYEYSDIEAQALHQDGLHRFGVLKLEPGKHHLRADFAARYADAPPDHWRAAGTLEQDFTVDAQPAYLQLELVKGSYVGKPDLQFHVLKPVADGPAGADLFAAGSSADPRLRYAAFLTASEHPLPALAELYALRRAGASSPDYAVQLNAALASFGVARAAGASQDDSPLASAYASYNQGVALMRQGNAAEGATLLEAVATGKIAGEEAAALRDQASLVLGYAQLRAHAGASAVPLFSRVRSPGPCSNPALLGLGWALLAPSGNGQGMQNGQPAVGGAQAPLQRIPVLLQPRLTEDIAKLKRQEPYQLRQASPQEEQALRGALVPWTELIGRDPLDPAVQEGMIAIPYALNHIGSYEEAREYFLRAARLLEAADAQLDTAMQRVRDGAMIESLQQQEAAERGWSWWLASYPREHWWLADDPRQPMAAPEHFYFQHLMANDAFRAAMQDYHDLRLLGAQIDRLDGGAALRPRLDAATTATAAQLRELALAELAREQRHTRMYLGEVRFALAHANELPPPAAAGGKS